MGLVDDRVRAGLSGALRRGPGQARRLARRVWPRAAVLTYHRVGTPELDPFGQAVAPETLRRQLAHLRGRYRVVALPELLSALAADGVPEGAVAVTFDDGYEDTLTEAAPAAAEAGVPIHVFVTVEPVLEGGGFWWDDLTRALLRRGGGQALGGAHAELKLLPPAERERRLAALRAEDGAGAPDLGRPLRAEELRELAGRPGVTIGSHTLSHSCLAVLPPDERLRELAVSRERLEAFLGLPVTTVSYPFGKEADVGEETTAAAGRAGYAAAFTSIGTPLTRASTRFALPRLSVHEWDDDVFRDRLRTLLGY